MNKNIILEKITKDIRIIKKRNQSNGKVSHRLVLELQGGYSTEIPMIDEDIQFIRLLNDIGYSEPIKSKKLVEEVSEVTGEVYICINIELADKKILKYFFPHTQSGFRFRTILDTLIEFELSKDKEKQDKENIKQAK